MPALGFNFHSPLRFFEKAGAGDRSRRIAGIISTDQKDQEGERILQRGLDFSHFLDRGWYNDNHSKKMADVLGYPEEVQQFGKGAKLPDETVAEANCTWAEGYLLRTKNGDQLWELGKALQGTPRSLGFSVEGKIQKRTGAGNKVIAKAQVRNVAITHAPVNQYSKLTVLAKSLQAVESGEEHDVARVALFKRLSMGTAPPGEAPVGPLAGEDAGAILVQESLESKQHPPKLYGEDEEDKKKRKRARKSLTDMEALVSLRRRLSKASPRQIGRLLTVIKTMKRKGLLA